MIRALALATTLIALLTGCAASANSSAAPQPATATAWAEAIKQPTTTQVVTITEDNDPNESLGRPGKYTDAAVIYDSRVECTDGPGYDCGAKIEIYPTQEAAQARSGYLTKIHEENPILGSEWDEVSGGVLLRVTGSLKPSEAQAYRDAFRRIADA